MSPALLPARIDPAPTAPEEVQPYLDRVRRKAEARLRAAAFDLRVWSVSVRAVVDAEGWLHGLEIVRTTGTWQVDRIVERALAKLFVANAPAALVGRPLMLELGAR